MTLRTWLAASLAAAFLLGHSTPAVAAPARKPAKPAVRKPAPAKKPSSRAAKPAPAKEPAWMKDLLGLDIAPASATLTGPRSRQRLIVIASLKDGATVDATSLASFNVSNPKAGKVVNGTLLPVADGDLRLTARIGKHTSTPADFKVENTQNPASVEFIADIMPILAKTGCNSTACHGSPAGKGGFKLSLFGYEPELDHAAIVKDGEGKRIDANTPEKSLLLQKATMAVTHAGGLRFKKDSPDYRVMLEWIKSGAPGLGEFVTRVKDLVVFPDQPFMPAPGARQRMAVTAVFSDGSTQDVTEKVIYTSNDDAIAAVDDEGVVQANRSGETALMVRYLGQVGIARIAVLPTWRLQPDNKTRPANYVDEAVRAKLQKLHTAPSDLCTDEEFVRRVYLDVCGLIPSPEETEKFLADTSPNKRARLIDRLLDTPEHVDLWTLRWNDTLRNNPQLTRVGAADYAGWVRKQLETNRPYDEWVRDLLTATGKNSAQVLDPNNLPQQLQRMRNVEAYVQQLNNTPPNPASNYYIVSRDPLDVTSATSQIFLGVRIECARCHNHPFERWTNSDYFGLAAFFTGVQSRGSNQAPRIVTYNPRTPGPRDPKTNAVVDPRLLDDSEFTLQPMSDRRAVVAQWMTSADNPWFARALVNRLWGHYFGRGIVEPIDDFRVTNPASNPELLDALARDFTANKFDVRHIHRVILNSRTYQQSSRPNQFNASDTANFARYYPKRLMAEQLYDSISQATGVFLDAGRGGGRRQNPGLQGLGRYGMAPQGPIDRVMQLPALVAGQGRGAGPLAFLTTFGKPRRQAVCECERTADGNIGQALALMNGDVVNEKIAAPRGRIQQIAAARMEDGEAVSRVYVACLTRRPTPNELDEAVALVRSASSRREGIEDLAWSLLNSREFLFNH